MSVSGSVPGDVVISQVYGGGGNTGAVYRNDFVELFNPGAATVSVAGWSVQYASATGTTWAVTALSGSIAAGGFYLVRLAAGAGGNGAPLPAPDATGTTNIAAVAGRVALVSTTAPLPCGTSCAGTASVRDLVGYGTAVEFEGGGAAPAGSNTTAVTRRGTPPTDTDDNAADFAAHPPNPRNTASPTLPPVADVVISQIYAGGGNAGAPWCNDFIELYNRGTRAVPLAGWSVQYAGATGGGWSVTALSASGVIAPGRWYLIAQASGGPAGAPLPPADDAGPAHLSATAGKVALVTGTAALNCGTACAGDPSVKDFVGYGATADTFEGSGPAPAASNTTAVRRAGDGAVDTGDNAADFLTGAPNPRNTATVPRPPLPSADLTVTKVASPDPVTAGQDLSYTIGVTNNGPDAAAAVELDDPLPAGTTFVSLSTPGDWAAATPAVGATGTVTVTGASLANGATASFTLVVLVDPSATGTLSNTATVTSATDDPDPSNNTATQVTTVNPVAARARQPAHPVNH